MLRICWGIGPSTLITALHTCTHIPPLTKCPRFGFMDLNPTVTLQEAETRAVQTVQAFLQPDWAGLICIYKHSQPDTPPTMAKQIIVEQEGED